MDWNDLRHFLAVARTGSVREAGASLGVSHSTVLRRLEALEDELGARLFDRSRGGFTLTRAGQDMVPGAERIEAETNSIERNVHGQDHHLEGEITITCADDWVADLLLSELRSFCSQHPGIQLRIGSDSRLFDMSKREADIAIRTLPVSKQPPQHLLGTLLAPLHVGTYVAKAHCERISPYAPESEARWVAFDDPNLHKHLAAKTDYPDLEAWGGISSLATMVSALKYGYGIGMLPCHVGDSEPALQRLGTSPLPHLGDIWMLSHPDLRTNARLQACRQAIVKAFQKHARNFAGNDSAAGESKRTH